jgi:hypothetical protein
MPKKKIQEIVRTAKRPAAPIKPAPSDPAAAESLAQFPAAFENKAGRYELIRIDGGQAYYSFTNHQERTVDAAMPVVTWRKMQERAVAAFKESA